MEKNNLKHDLTKLEDNYLKILSILKLNSCNISDKKIEEYKKLMKYLEEEK